MQSTDQSTETDSGTSTTHARRTPSCGYSAVTSSSILSVAFPRGRNSLAGTERPTTTESSRASAAAPTAGDTFDLGLRRLVPPRRRRCVKPRLGALGITAVVLALLGCSLFHVSPPSPEA